MSSAVRTSGSNFAVLRCVLDLIELRLKFLHLLIGVFDDWQLTWRVGSVFFNLPSGKSIKQEAAYSRTDQTNHDDTETSAENAAPLRFFLGRFSFESCVAHFFVIPCVKQIMDGDRVQSWVRFDQKSADRIKSVPSAPV